MPAGKERIAEIVAFSKIHGEEETLKEYTLTYETLQRYFRVSKQCSKITVVASTKKTGFVDWREWSAMLQNHQALHEKASWSQDKATCDHEAFSWSA